MVDLGLGMISTKFQNKNQKNNTEFTDLIAGGCATSFSGQINAEHKWNLSVILAAVVTQRPRSLGTCVLR